MHPARIDLAAPGGGIGPEQLVQGPETSHLAAPAEAPGRRAQPADVLGRVARVRQLPVEHPAQAVGADQEVAHAEVAVHGHPGPGGGAVPRQPAHAELQSGAGLAERVEEGQRVAQRVGPGKPVDPVGVDGVDGGERAGALGGERTPGVRPLGVAQDLARDRLPLQPLDDHPVRAHVVPRPHRHHRGHRDAGGARPHEAATAPSAPCRPASSRPPGPSAG